MEKDEFYDIMTATILMILASLSAYAIVDLLRIAKLIP